MVILLGAHLFHSPCPAQCMNNTVAVFERCAGASVAVVTFLFKELDDMVEVRDSSLPYLDTL